MGEKKLPKKKSRKKIGRKNVVHRNLLDGLNPRPFSVLKK